MGNKHYFYVVKCRDGSFYAGYTTDVARREYEHNYLEKGAKYTKTRRPVKVVYFKAFASRSEATKAEAEFKKLKRKEKEKFLYGTNSKELF